jgi:2-oxoglutarate/2-oxoacid ferredoxin oxidoreductase subunit alpha
MEDLNIVIGGAAGEGIQTIGEVLAEAISALGYAVFTWQENESRIRGGLNSYSVRVSEKVVNAPMVEADILLTLSQRGVNKYGHLLKPDGILIAPVQRDERTIAMSLKDMAEQELGNAVYANTIAVGALAAALGLDLRLLKRVLARQFAAKGDEVVAANHLAAQKGYDFVQVACQDICHWRLPGSSGRYYLLPANRTIPLAAVYAGCRFMAAYPMSPSTEIITYLAAHEDRFGIFTEQAEDEIAAINMAIGASFAGARAMTATSGGGFSLMVEGISLSGMMEVPVVVILAQRPGPATGLPTRTAQGDLLFAVNAGHGEFPKMVLAPADARDAFQKVVRAFNLADKYQMPVILMTDQFLHESLVSIESFDFEREIPTCHLADPSTMHEYLRYQFTESGISPRLYPGQSTHLVAADSDEHDEMGHITEDLAGTALAMMQKRLAKLALLRKEVAPPETHGLDQAEVVFVAWGSTRQAILEGMELLRARGLVTGLIHFTELWPLPIFQFPKNKLYWSLEGNSTGQLARLLRSEYGLEFSGEIKRYDGFPLTGEFLSRCFHD